MTSLMDCSITSAISSFMILRSKSASLWTIGPTRSDFEDLLFDFFLRLLSALFSGDRNASFGVVGGSCGAEVRLRSDRSVDLDLVASKIKILKLFKWDVLILQVANSSVSSSVVNAAQGSVPTICRSLAECPYQSRKLSQSRSEI